MPHLFAKDRVVDYGSNSQFLRLLRNFRLILIYFITIKTGLIGFAPKINIFSFKTFKIRILTVRQILNLISGFVVFPKA